MTLRRFWMGFEAAADGLPPGVAHGVGVTTTDAAAAERLVEQRVFGVDGMPEIRAIVEDVDLSTLDQDHVLPNLGSPFVAGVWFPLGS